MDGCRLERAQAPLSVAAVSLAFLLCSACGPATAPADGPRDVEAGARKTEPGLVTALGRLEPKDGIIRVAGPSRPSVVIAKLVVEEGDRVEAGQPIAVLDTK